MKDIKNLSEPNGKLIDKALTKITNSESLDYLIKMNKLIQKNEGQKLYTSYQRQIMSYLTALRHMNIINLLEQTALYEYFANYKIL